MISDRARAAQAALEIPLFMELLADMEKTAVQACINAPYNDHEKRQASALEARAVQQLRSRLETISREGQAEPVSRKAPA